MKNKVKFAISLGIVAMVFISVTAMAATVLFPSGGGTGTATKPGKGSILAGASSTAYGVVATSTDGKCLTASSTAPYGVSWENCSGTTFDQSLNTTDSPTFVSSTLSSGPLTVSGASPSVITGDGTANVLGGSLFIPSASDGIKFSTNNDGISSITGISSYATGSVYMYNPQAGVYFDLSAVTADQTYTFTDSGITTGGGLASSTITNDGTLSIIGGDLLVNGTALHIGNGTGNTDLYGFDVSTQAYGIQSFSPSSTQAFTFFAQDNPNGGAIMDISQLTADRTYRWPNASGTLALTTDITASSSFLKVSNNLSDVASTTTAKNNLLGTGTANQVLTYDGTKWGAAGQKTQKCQWVASYGTSTTAWNDDICILESTSTLRGVWVKQQTTGDSVAWNLYYGSTMPSATTTGAFKVFSADQTTTATSTARLTPTASSTPRLGDFLRIYAYNASSTEFTMTIYYDEN